jgi:hypothetical protein
MFGIYTEEKSISVIKHSAILETDESRTARLFKTDVLFLKTTRIDATENYENYTDTCTVFY